MPTARAGRNRLVPHQPYGVPFPQSGKTRQWRREIWAPLARSPLNDEETPQRESPRLKLMPKNRCAADLPLDHRRYERNLEIARKAGEIRGSGRGRDSSESYERCGRMRGGARITMRRDAAHDDV